MARYALIDGYLDAMRTKIRWRGDLDDVVAEMEDHLYSTVEHMLARGTEPDAAQRATLDRFGDPTVLATAYASTDRGGMAVPTRFTKTAGVLAKIAAVLLVGLPIAWTLTVYLEELTGSWDFVEVMVFSVGGMGTLMPAALLIVLTMVGLLQRHGGFGWLGLIAVALAGIGAAATFIPWLIFGWGALLGGGMLLMALLVLRRGIAPVLPTLAFGTGMLIGLGVFLALDALEVGWRDSYGDYPVAALTGLWTMCLVTAGGLFGVGRWLASEEPVDVEAPAVA